jgi:nickel-dependent lactate racemase
MSSLISLAYGRSTLDFSFDDSRFSIITKNSDAHAPLSDFEVGRAFDSPIASAPIDEIVGSDDSVLIVVSDATRATASAQIVNLLLRRLIQAGVSPLSVCASSSTTHMTAHDSPRSEKRPAV